MLRVAMSLLGSLPPMIGFGLDPADALFESVSAVTAGEAVVVGLDDLPQSLLFRTACPVIEQRRATFLAFCVLIAHIGR